MEEAEYCDRIGLIHRGELIAAGTPRELKLQLMQDEILEVACQRPQDAMLALEGLEAVKEAALFGNGLHIVTEDGKAAAPAVRSALEQAGYAVHRVEPIAPSLEDVFVSLVEARDRAQG